MFTLTQCSRDATQLEWMHAALFSLLPPPPPQPLISCSFTEHLPPALSLSLCFSPSLSHPLCAKLAAFPLEGGGGSISDNQNFWFWDESLWVDHHDNHLQAITMCSRGWKRRTKKERKNEEESESECKG